MYVEQHVLSACQLTFVICSKGRFGDIPIIGSAVLTGPTNTETPCQFCTWIIKKVETTAPIHRQPGIERLEFVIFEKSFHKPAPRRILEIEIVIDVQQQIMLCFDGLSFCFDVGQVPAEGGRSMDSFSVCTGRQ